MILNYLKRDICYELIKDLSAYPAIHISYINGRPQ